MNTNEAMTPEQAREALVTEAENLVHLADIRFGVSVELGRKAMSLGEVRRLRPDDVIQLEKVAGEEYEIRVNGHQIGVGTITVRDDLMGCRVQQIRSMDLSPELRAARENMLLEAGGVGAAGGEAAPEHVDGMIYIPPGVFRMGGREEDSPENQRPAHSVYLDGYHIGQFPVTNQEYCEFANCTGHKTPIHWQGGSWPTGAARHPVVNVSWQDAKAYANWQGCRLPTEAEWEKAARGTDERLYPWGNRFVEGERCNNNNMVGTTLPVDEFPLGRSPYGVWDLSGNVQEWCEDHYDEGYYEFSPSSNPRGPEGSQERVIRGGFFAENRPGVRTTHRGSAPETHTREYIGFRLAKDVG